MLALCGQSFEPVWTDFAGGVTRTAEWRKAVNEMGEIPVLEVDGVRLTQTAPILLKTRRAIWPLRRRERGGEIRSAALAVLGQSQAVGLHGDVPLLSDFHALARSKRAGFLPQAARRFPPHSRDACAAKRLCCRTAAYDRGYFDDRLFALSGGRDRI